MVLYLCISSDDALYLYQVSRKYLEGFPSYQEDAVCILKFSKGHNSVNSEGGVMALVLSTLSDDVLYLYHVHRDPTDMRESRSVFQISTINRSKLDKRQVSVIDSRRK